MHGVRRYSFHLQVNALQIHIPVSISRRSCVELLNCDPPEPIFTGGTFVTGLLERVPVRGKDRVLVNDGSVGQLELLSQDRASECDSNCLAAPRLNRVFLACDGHT